MLNRERSASKKSSLRIDPTQAPDYAAKKEVAMRVMIGLLCISPLLAYLLPERPFTLWTWTAVFADFAARLVPGIDQLTRVSEMPQVTRLYMSIAWLVFGPIWFGILLKFAPVTEMAVVNMMRVTKARWWYYIVLCPIVAPFLFLSIWAAPFITPETFANSDMAVMSQSRFWLGVIGSASVLFAAGALFLFVKSFSIIRIAYICRDYSTIYRKKSK